MASEVLNQIQEDHLTCQICQCPFYKPKALVCLHTFCEGCLRDFIFSRQYDRTGHFPCPLCRREITIPPGGVSEFPDNHLIISLQDTLGQSENLLNAAQEDVENATRARAQYTTSREVSQTRSQAPSSRHRQLFVPVRHNYQGASICFGRKGTSVTEFNKPIGLAVNAEYIIVSEQYGNRIMVFDWRGKLKSTFVSPGKIHDIAINSRGHLVVANSKAGHCLAIEYSLNGQKVSVLGNMFEFEKAHGVSILNQHDDLVITSTETNTVFILSRTGKLIQKFGGSGQADPRFVATNKTGDILLSSRTLHSIKICNKFGKQIDRIGGEGNRPGELKYPMGLCVDQKGDIIVADWGNKRVQVLSQDGNFSEVLIDYRRSSEPKAPINVALSSDFKRLVVLVAGVGTAEVCVYPYRGISRKEPVVSSFCSCS